MPRKKEAALPWRPKRRDCNGRAVPPHLLPAFNNQHMHLAIARLGGLADEIGGGLQLGPADYSPFLDAQCLMNALGDAREALIHSVEILVEGCPAAVCLACRGAGCATCRSSGLVPQNLAQSLALEGELF